MSIRLTRYRSEETGPFSRSGRNRAHITIPASAGFADLEHSTLVLRMRMNSNAVRPASLQVAPHMMIRRAKESSDRVGTISEKIFQNNVNGTLDNYNYSRSEGEAARNLGMRDGYYIYHSNQATGNWTNTINDSIPGYDYRGYVTPFYQPSTPKFLGDTTSQDSVMNRPEIHIPMKYISALATSENARNQMPIVALGDLKYEIELDNRLRCTQWDPTISWDCNDATADGGGAVADLTLTTTFEDEVDLRKLDLGQGVDVTVSWTGGSGGPGSQNVTLGAVAAGATGIVTLTVNLSGLAGGQTLTGVTINLATAPAEPEYEIEDMFVELHRLQLAPQQLDNAVRAMSNLTIMFQDYYLKPEQMAAGPIYEQTMQVPRNARGVAVLTCRNITTVSDAQNLYSGWDNAERYRFEVTDSQGVLRPTTNRDVPTYNAAGRFAGSSDYLDVWNNRGLHNIRLKEFFANINKPLKRYDYYGNVSTGVPNSQEQRRNRAFYPQMLVPSEDPQAMNFLVRTDGTNNMSQKTVLFVFIRDRALVLNNGQARLT